MKYTPKTKEGEELIFYNYKEPLTRIENGYGYYGVLLSSKDEAKVQCHICGELFEALFGHIRQAHGMKTVEYREKYKLAYTTALISEKRRLALKSRTIEWLNNMSPQEKARMVEARKRRWIKYLNSKKNRVYGKGITLETKNKRGTCPDQLIDKVRKVAKALGHSPTKNEFIDFYKSQKYVHIIYKTFGSWDEVKKRAGLSLIKTNQLNGKSKKHRYTKEEIIDYMKLFYRENNKPPTATDCRRGLIPDSNIIKRLFGSMQEARFASGITDPVGRWKDRN